MPVILTYIKFSLVYTVISRIWEHIIPHSNSLCRQWDIMCVGHLFLTVAVLFDIQKQRVACQTLVILQHLTGKCIINTSINPLNAELNPICYLLALLTHHFLHVSRIRVNAQLQERMSVKNGLLKSEIYFRIVNYPHCQCVNVEMPSQCSPHSLLHVLI